MWLSSVYDVPQDVADGPHSPEFRQFLDYWFGSVRVSFDERLTAATRLSAEEAVLARQLIRRALKSKRNHIISGTWVLGDLEALPLLRKMFDDEPDERHRLLIAGALWKLNKDPLLIECLNRAKVSGLFSVYFHLCQILWLNDERAIDFLIDLLPETDQSVEHGRKLRRLSRILFKTPFRRIGLGMLRRHAKAEGAAPWALGLLNHLETGHLVPPDEQRSPSYYRERGNDPAFRERMLEAVQKSVAQMHHGR